MIEQLRERTGKQHQELERVLIPSIKAVNTPEAYVQLLQLFYGYYYPLEQHIAAHMDISFPEVLGGAERRLFYWMISLLSLVRLLSRCLVVQIYQK